jgi:CubicO group peptidase (beta-lactamase class C family)
MPSPTQKWSRRAILTSALMTAGLARWGKFDAIGQAVESARHAGRANCIAIAVARDGRILWEAGFGATAHTPFSLASITKPFTTAAVMRLVQMGKLELDAPIDHYLESPLPRSRFPTEAVTPRLLGGHAAGLPTLFEMFSPPQAPKTLTDLIRDYGELAYPAGERYEYANLGYSLLGAAISHITGKEFAASLGDLVIGPLGLRDTFFDTDSARMPTAARRYDQNNHAIPFYTTATPPSGELYASAHDLSIFAASMLQVGRAPLLGRTALQALFSPVFTGPAKAFTTFGWSGRDIAGERIIVKTGGQPGVAARLTLLPARKICIAVLANRDDNRELVANISSQIAASLIPDWSNPDFQIDPVTASAGTRPNGAWTGSIRNGDASRSLSIQFDAIADITTHANTLSFKQDGMDFQLVARGEGILHGRCLSMIDEPGFTATEPHIVTLTRS